MKNTNKNILEKTRTYLVGHMQYASGRDWREYVENELEKLQEWKSTVSRALWVLFSGLIGLLGWIFSEAVGKL